MPYATGTIALTQGSTAVTGTGTAFSANVAPGARLLGPDGRTYTVAAVASATGLTLTSAYLGATVSGAGYKIFAVANSLAAVANAVNLYSSDGVTVAGGWNPATQTLSAPAFAGNGVMESDTDSTSGRLMKVGAGGWAKAQGAYPPEYDFDTWGVSPSGAYWFNNAADAGPEGLNYGVVLAMNYAASRQMRLAMNADASKAWIGYIDNASVQSPWSMLYGQRSILGPVSQAGGVPDGALIERGSNANGSYIRWADGTQLCWRTMGALTGGAQTWTFPVVFAAAPVVTGAAQAAVLSCVCLDAAPTTTTATFSARDKTDARRADTCHLTAIGRWF